MKNVDSIKKLVAFTNKWIALDKKRELILASGKTIKDVESQLKKNKQKAEIIEFVPSTDQYLAPYVNRGKV